ncbi:unnamed protein product [Lactuca virosa]|uniref:Uncharacterized protein n=1 Tax=Lactuca virosa TaxID=75947 RepID=A0AAU9NLH5_9ASTR|nr:unnamed protein product [Lactuca virosa]
MDKIGCYEFIERFTGRKFCEALLLTYCHQIFIFPKEWLEEHKEEVVDNIVEEVLDGAGLLKEIETCHLDDEDENENEDEDKDEDEDDHGAEDVDADEDEDNHNIPHFIKKDNGPDVEMGDNAALGGPLEEAMDEDEDVYPQLPNFFIEKLHWKEQELVLVEPQTDEVMRVNESEQVVRYMKLRNWLGLIKLLVK